MLGWCDSDIEIHIAETLKLKTYIPHKPESFTQNPDRRQYSMEPKPFNGRPETCRKYITASSQVAAALHITLECALL